MGKHQDKKIKRLQARIRHFDEVSKKRSGGNKPGSLSGRK